MIRNSKFKNTNLPLLLSLNVQCLQSKFDSFKNFILNLLNNNVPIDVIALQEVWKINLPEQLTIPGFHPLEYTQRENTRGGGVGFFVNNKLSFKKNS